MAQAYTNIQNNKLADETGLSEYIWDLKNRDKN